jgi:hypothetical protein
MVVKMREKFSRKETDWDPLGAYQNAIYLSVALMFDTGKRIGNVCHPDGKFAEDHCIRVRDVQFFIQPLASYVEAGPEFRNLYRILP